MNSPTMDFSCGCLGELFFLLGIGRMLEVIWGQCEKSNQQTRFKRYPGQILRTSLSERSPLGSRPMVTSGLSSGGGGSGTQL